MTLRRNHVPADESRTRVYAALPNLASAHEQGAHEQGLGGFEAPTWLAVFLPRGASEPIIRKLNQAAFATADTPSAQERRTKEPALRGLCSRSSLRRTNISLERGPARLIQ
jgi:tripartite-type tricarboxylate transporter receptor subunit TctC